MSRLRGVLGLVVTSFKTQAAAVLAFAREVLKAEFLTPAGVLNALWMFAAFVLVTLAGVGNLWQVLVRTVDDDYHTGMPSFIWLLLAYGGLSMICIAIVGAYTRPPK